jgi:hypothetical protein
VVNHSGSWAGRRRRRQRAIVATGKSHSPHYWSHYRCIQFRYQHSVSAELCEPRSRATASRRVGFVAVVGQLASVPSPMSSPLYPRRIAVSKADLGPRGVESLGESSNYQAIGFGLRIDHDARTTRPTTYLQRLKQERNRKRNCTKAMCPSGLPPVPRSSPEAPRTELQRSFPDLGILRCCGSLYRN